MVSKKHRTRIRKNLVIAALCLAAGSGGGYLLFNSGLVFHTKDIEATDAVNTLPMVIQDPVKPLEDLQDAGLQNALDKIVRNNSQLNSLAAGSRMSVGLVDLSDPYNARFAQVNGDHMMYAASLPKIAVLLASMEAIEEGKIRETADVKTDMRQMIAVSSNSAATRMIDRVGFDMIADVLKSPKYHLYDEANGGGLWVGKRYAQTGSRVGDPLKNLSHAASATQVCRFYYMLAYGELVNYKRSKEMLQFLVDPELHHKFVNTLDQIAPEARVYRKSGTWQNFHADSVLVWEGSKRRYILVALIDSPEGESIIRNLIRQVDDMLQADHVANL